MRHPCFPALIALCLLAGCSVDHGQPEIAVTLTVTPHASEGVLDFDATVVNTGTAAALYPCGPRIPGVLLQALWGPLLIDPLNYCDGPNPAPDNPGVDVPCHGVFRLEPGEELHTVFSLTGDVFLDNCTPLTLPPGPYRLVTAFDFRSEFEDEDVPLRHIEKTEQISWPADTSAE